MYDNYKIVLGSYEDYVLYNGLKQADSPYGISIKDGKSKYFMIKCNGEFIDDFSVEVDFNNWIKINRNNISKDNKDYMKFIIDGLKKYDFNHVMFIIPIEEKEKILFIKSYFRDTVSESYFQGKWEYLKIRVKF